MQYVENSASLLRIKDPIRLIEYAGRTCYQSRDKIDLTNNKNATTFLQKLVESGHHSVLEHAIIHVHVEDEALVKAICLLGHGSFVNCTSANWVVGNVRAWLYLTKFMTHLLTHSKSLLTPLVRLVAGIRATNVVLYDILFEPIISQAIYVNTAITECNDPFEVLTDPLAYIDRVKQSNISDAEIALTTYFSFNIICDRAIAQQLTRHRLAAVSMESTRYCDYANSKKFPEGITFIKPQNASEEFQQAVHEINKQQEQTYMDLRNTGIPPEDARGILPLNTKTEFVFTTNVNHYQQIIALRTDKAAQSATGFIAKQIAEAINSIQ